MPERPRCLQGRGKFSPPGEPNREGRHGEDRPEKHDFRDGERRRRKLDERRHDRERKRCADLEANPFEHAADLQINVCRRNPKGTACLLVVLKRKGSTVFPPPNLTKKRSKIDSLSRR